MHLVKVNVQSAVSVKQNKTKPLADHIKLNK